MLAKPFNAPSSFLLEKLSVFSCTRNRCLRDVHNKWRRSGNLKERKFKKQAKFSKSVKKKYVFSV